MNNERYLNILEYLAKALYDVGATVKHIYKDEHPAMPNMSFPPFPPAPPALWSNQTNQFPPAPPTPPNIPFPPLPQQLPQCPQNPPSMPSNNKQEMPGYMYNKVFKPKQTWHGTPPKAQAPNEFCNMQDYTFQKMNGQVPANAKILDDPFMKPNQMVKSDPDQMHTVIDLAGGCPESISDFIKKNPAASKNAEYNVNQMTAFAKFCDDVSGSKLDDEINVIKSELAKKSSLKSGDVATLSNKLVGLSLARNYLSILPKSDEIKKFLADELKDNTIALAAFTHAIEQDELEQKKAIHEHFQKMDNAKKVAEQLENLGQYNAQRVMAQYNVGVGKDFKDSMDNFYSPKSTGSAPGAIDFCTNQFELDPKQRMMKAGMTKNYLESINAKESVANMSQMLDMCQELSKTPVSPSNEVMEEAKLSLTEENLKRDASEIKADDRPVIPEKEEIPEMPVVPEPEEPKKEVKKEIKKTIKKEVKKESETPEKTEESTQVTSASAL